MLSAEMYVSITVDIEKLCHPHLQAKYIECYKYLVYRKQ